jgi:phosphate transport system substrate-binding protein
MIYPKSEDIPAGFNYPERIKTSKTHNAILNLIDKEVDFILSARSMSDDEKDHAEEMGVTLIETPIALDAFIFIVNRQNKIKSLTTKQIQDIYMGILTNWSDAGGNNQTINPYVRNANSGSQELMETLVMKNVGMKDWATMYDPIYTLGGMDLVFRAVTQDVSSICFSLYYYHEQMMKENIAKAIAVDGVPPDKKTIRERNYPFVAEVYAVIRSDLEKSSMAYRLYELMVSDNAKPVITASGYVSN